MRSIQHTILEFAGEVATANPKAWIYTWAMLGVVTGLAIYGVVGWALGSLFGYGTEASYLAEAWYAFWFAQNVDALKGRVDHQVKVLEELIKDAGL